MGEKICMYKYKPEAPFGAAFNTITAPKDEGDDEA